MVVTKVDDLKYQVDTQLTEEVSRISAHCSRGQVKGMRANRQFICQLVRFSADYIYTHSQIHEYPPADSSMVRRL